MSDPIDPETGSPTIAELLAKARALPQEQRDAFLLTEAEDETALRRGTPYPVLRQKIEGDLDWIAFPGS